MITAAGLPLLCCWRPIVMVFDGEGNKVGNVDDPFACCSLNQRIYGIDGEQIYGIAGSCCQVHPALRALMRGASNRPHIQIIRSDSIQ